MLTAQIAEFCHVWLAGAALTGFSGAAVSRVGPDGTAEVVFGSDELATALLELQTVLGEGPAVLALQRSAPVLLTDLRSAPGRSTWIAFDREAERRGAAAYLALTLQIGVISLGVLGVHAPHEASLGDRELAGLLTLADTLALALLARDSVALDAGGAGLLGPGAATIHQASGMLSVQLGTSIADGLAALRAHAYASGRPLADTAQDVVRRRLRLDGAHHHARPEGEEHNGPQGGDGDAR